MLHALAVFEGGDIQNFGKGGEPYMGGLDNPLETMVGFSYITPTRWFFLLGIINSINTDSSSFAQYT